MGGRHFGARQSHGDSIWRRIVTMAVTRNWISKHTGHLGEVRNIYKNLDLKACKKITIRFDPFREDSKDARHFSHLITSYPASKSKLQITIRTEIYCDRSDPTVNVDLVNGESILMNCFNLKLKDIFELLHKHVTPLTEKDKSVKELKIKRKILSKIK